MSWIRDTSGQLVNLEFMESITLNELEADEDRLETITHGVFANDADGESFLLVQGEEGYCQSKLEQIASKLPMVKP